MMTEMYEKKSIKNFLKLLFKKDKKKTTEKPIQPVEEQKYDTTQTIQSILDGVRNLKIKTDVDLKIKNNVDLKTNKDVDLKTNEEQEDPNQKDYIPLNNSEDDESKDFIIKTLIKDGRVDRTTSHSSDDSGFNEKNAESDEEKLNNPTANETKVASKETIDKENDKIEVKTKDGCDENDKVIDVDRNGKERKYMIVDGKKVRVQTVYLKRGPTPKKREPKKVAPYEIQHTTTFQQIQINRESLTGGQVIINEPKDIKAIENALKSIEETSHINHNELGEDWLNTIDEFIAEQAKIKYNDFDILRDFLPFKEMFDEHLITCAPERPMEPDNPIDEFNIASNHTIQPDTNATISGLDDFLVLSDDSAHILTPPYSDTLSSPNSCDFRQYRNPGYLYSPSTSSSTATLSPTRFNDCIVSPPNVLEDCTNVSDDHTKNVTDVNVEKGEKMTLKQFKDLQKDISASFSKMQCCQTNRIQCRTIFERHLQKLDANVKMNLCYSVAVIDLKNVFEALQSVLYKLCQGILEDENYVLFYLLCQKVLTQRPEWFVEDFGLEIFSTTALRCSRFPVLTRLLVDCVRLVIQRRPELVQDRRSVFCKVDSDGNTLISACVRRGDSCADVLAELTKRESTEIPLFLVNSLNTEGLSALHIACSEHSEKSPRLHCVHILLEHAFADLWLGDTKGGDTCVHMAVNSVNCDLRLVMVLFKHLDRKMWSKLARVPNTSATTPLDHARAAMKSRSRYGYPIEVLEFLKKCR